jgi:hypothetical protein
LKNLTLVIPTHGRVNKQTTLGALPTALKAEVVLVASLPEEAKALKALYPNNDVLTAKGTASIAEKRHWIMGTVSKLARARGHLLFMLDDDLAFFQRCPPKWREWDEARGAYGIRADAPTGTSLMTRLYPTDKELLRLFQELDKRVATHAPALLGIAHRRHSDKKKESWDLNGRMMYAFGVDPARYKTHKIRFDAVRVREDFHVVLSMLRAGEQGHSFCELLNNEYGSFGAPGGCSGERDMTLSDAQCFRLQELHPGFVKVVDREYKGSIPRKEVVVSWKKAYESSTAKK